MRKVMSVMALVAFTMSLVPMPAAGVRVQLREGMVVKAKGFPSLYYIGASGIRYVFPNDKIYSSWYDNFSNATEVDASDLAPHFIGGNVPYRPGALLIKIDTDPKVYAVSANGVIQWVQTEALAKQLYGDHWNLLVDDVPVAFFANYVVGAAIGNAADFDPETEEASAASISDNVRARQITRQVKQNLKLCDKMERQVNKIQKRLQKRGLPTDIVVNDFVARCTAAALQPDVPDQDKQKSKGKDRDDDEKNEPSGNRGDKITICHIPPGNPAAKTTITVGAPALKAHLKHGDKLGACDGGIPGDTQPPVISHLNATSTAPTTATVSWQTNEPATGKVTYATQTLANASTTAQMATHAGLLTNHAINLASLATSTTYYFTVESRDANGNTATSTEMTFTTAATPPPADAAPPVISGITVTPHATSTDVAWTTDEPASSKIVYATQSLATATSTLSVFSAGLATAHALTLSNLATSTQYFFKVESKDASANTALSAEQTFTTTP